MGASHRQGVPVSSEHIGALHLQPGPFPLTTKGKHCWWSRKAVGEWKWKVSSSQKATGEHFQKRVKERFEVHPVS